MQVKQLTDELLNETLKSMGMSTDTKDDAILTSEYVSQFNRGVAYRIQHCENAHAVSVDLANKTQLR